MGYYVSSKESLDQWFDRLYRAGMPQNLWVHSIVDLTLRPRQYQKRHLVSGVK